MQHHHKAWLAAHPNRTREWLTDKIRDGFDVHHVDRNRKNNKPENLVLIEHEDHMRFHGLSFAKKYGRSREEVLLEQLTLGQRAYELYTPQLCWDGVAEALDIKRALAVSLAREYANTNCKPWPIAAARGYQIGMSKKAQRCAAERALACAALAHGLPAIE